MPAVRGANIPEQMCRSSPSADVHGLRARYKPDGGASARGEATAHLGHGTGMGRQEGVQEERAGISPRTPPTCSHSGPPRSHICPAPHRTSIHDSVSGLLDSPERFVSFRLVVLAAVYARLEWGRHDAHGITAQLSAGV